MRTTITLIALLFSIVAGAQDSLTILHTNDTHSCIEPEKDGGAGIVNRAHIISELRDSIGAENILLFDCGDFSQGSLYYNIFKGSTEIEAMNAMRYDAGAIGNHEFDFGIGNLARLARMAEYPLLCANYDFTGTPCEGIIRPYTVIRRQGIKIGVFALSPDPRGLVAAECYEGVEFMSPIEAANTAVAALKGEGCDIIICLSHLGWKIGNEYNDERLATETSGIDIILGGHSHDHFNAPIAYKNSKGADVYLHQAGKNGRFLGLITVELE